MGEGEGGREGGRGSEGGRKEGRQREGEKGRGKGGRRTCVLSELKAVLRTQPIK